MSVDEDEPDVPASDDPIPIADPVLGEAEATRVLDVLDGGMLADGPEVRRFEEEFAAYCGTEYGVATSNGTTALHAAFEALGIGEGDHVVTTPFSFVASANSIRLAGATPVFVDVDPETYNLDPNAVERAMRADGPDIDAILAVHLYGLPAEMDRLAEIAAEHDALLVEDAAQAHGAEYDGRRVGTFGDAACFSFYPTKNMTTGEGGMVVTDRDDVADRATRYVNHGRTDTYAHAEVGHNHRMTSVAAAIGRAQLERLPEHNEARRANAARLTEALRGTAVEPPTEPANARHVYHQYTVRCENRDELMRHLAERGVDAGVYYPTCIHDQPAYDGYACAAPAAERATTEVLSLPVHPNLSENDVDTIITAVESYE